MADASTSVPAVSFTSFLISLGSSALVHLGEIPEPGSAARKPDLTLARHTIDVLAILHDKTRGNLDEDEARLLDALLGELRGKLAAAPR